MVITISCRPLQAPAALRSWLPGSAAVAATVLLLGCQGTQSLAARDAFFTSASSASVHAGLEVDAIVAAHLDRTTFQRACGAVGAAAVAGPPDLVCHVRTTRFFGRRAEAYRRWAEDRVRQLPSPSDTASAAGG